MPLAKSLIILALLVLYGCQSTPGDHLTRSGTNGPIYYSDIPTGATLTLLQPVVIPAEQVSTVLPRRSPGAGEYSTHCRLELWTRNPREVVVEADRFVITKVRGGLTPILVAAPKRSWSPASAPAHESPGGVTAPICAAMPSCSSSPSANPTSTASPVAI